MALVWNKTLDQPIGFMNFPTYDDEKYTMRGYFMHYEAEKRVIDKNKGIIWVKKHSAVQNHFYDCRIYNIAIKEILVNLVCREAGIPTAEVSYDKYVALINGDI